MRTSTWSALSSSSLSFMALVACGSPPRESPIDSGLAIDARVASAERDAANTDRAVPLWGADAGGTPITELPVPPHWALAVGNEGAGLSPATLALVTQTVALPISAAVESLNVAVATGILLFALR